MDYWEEEKRNLLILLKKKNNGIILKINKFHKLKFQFNRINPNNNKDKLKWILITVNMKWPYIIICHNINNNNNHKLAYNNNQIINSLSLYIFHIQFLNKISNNLKIMNNKLLEFNILNQKLIKKKKKWKMKWNKEEEKELF